MKFFVKLSALTVTALFTVAVASATTYQFGSYSTTAPVNEFGNQNTPLVFVPSQSTTGTNVPTTSTTVDIPSGPPDNPWHTALPNSAWVSWGPTGPTTPPNFAPNGNYVFTSSFTLDGQATGFSFSILADDTVTMYIDGQTGAALFMQDMGLNTVCQVGLPDCRIVDTVSSATSPFTPEILALLTPGTHTATFIVLNNHLIDMGLDFSATVTTAGNVIPEPSSLLLLGTGLIGSAGLIMRSVRTRA
jgi:hypothetical protein